MIQSPEQLLGLPKPVNELTDEELITHLTPFFPYTRPKKPLNYQLGKALTDDTVSAGSTNPLAEKMKAAFLAAGLDETGTRRIKPKSTLNIRRL